MSNSKLLKEAIADAKAVRETAIANAKIALEEAFTPRLQSILSQKLQQEMEDEEEADVNEEYGAEDTSDADSSGIDGDNKQPADDANSSSDLAQGNPDTDVETAEVGSEDENTEKAQVSESEEEGDDEAIEEGEYNAEGEEEVVAEEEGEDESEEDEDELDLESIIRELEEELDDEEEEEVEDIAQDVVDGHEEEMHEEESEEESMDEAEEEEEMHEEEDLDEEIDLNEILREMGYGEEEEEEIEETVEENNELEEVKAELEAAMSTISELKSTINEVNLLNAKLLYTNKLFRSYDLTNEQKMKVVETLDRTGNVREVKLVFSTLAESFKFNGTAKKQKQTKLTESFASAPVASTAPSKEVITESTNTMADRFKKLANIK